MNMNCSPYTPPAHWLGQQWVCAFKMFRQASAHAGLYADWKVAHVTITHGQSGEKRTFVPSTDEDAWLRTGRPKGFVERQLLLDTDGRAHHPQPSRSALDASQPDPNGTRLAQDATTHDRTPPPHPPGPPNKDQHAANGSLPSDTRARLPFAPLYSPPPGPPATPDEADSTPPSSLALGPQAAAQPVPLKWPTYPAQQHGAADYSLVVTTGPERGAGTTGTVSMQLRGFGCASRATATCSICYQCDWSDADNLRLWPQTLLGALWPDGIRVAASAILHICRPKYTELTTGRQVVPCMFTVGSSVTAWLSGIADVGDIDEVEVFLEPSPMSTAAEAEWKLDSISVCKFPPGNRFETFYCHRCAHGALFDQYIFVGYACPCEMAAAPQSGPAISCSRSERVVPAGG
jgi:hypothetical protein